ncbi:hypothetical protein DFQ29_005062 [Apophysomyces sp. BC1021]|nr:hypothetical protein DFQ29_005062 [Apophysomyces sp. BC1021]
MLGTDPKKELLKDTARLSAFLQECLAFGSLRGFKHFEVFLRGREELLLSVYDPKKTLPARREPSTLMPVALLQHRVQEPKPWSPADQDLKNENDRTVFLVAGYARYKCPYVWTTENDTDNPLMLKTTTKWKTQETALWEIIWEIIAMTADVANPLALEKSYIDNLPIDESISLSGALVDFLQTVWIQAEPDVPFVDMGKKQKTNRFILT